MRDYSEEQLRESRPDITTLKGIQFCLNQLMKDASRIFTDEVCTNCTYEELIGALLLAEDYLIEDEKNIYREKEE